MQTLLKHINIKEYRIRSCYMAGESLEFWNIVGRASSRLSLFVDDNEVSKTSYTSHYFSIEWHS